MNDAIAQEANGKEHDLLAAVDLGSNSFHMVVGRVVQGQLHLIDRLREQLSLAAGIDRDGNLTSEAQQRGFDCLERFAQRLRRVPHAHLRAVGTSALRKAQNAQSFLRKARLILGHPIEIISGFEEARLIYLGVAHSLADDQGLRLVVDIGGGSTECIIGKRFETVEAASLHMGCVEFTSTYFPDGALDREHFRRASRAARSEMEPIARRFRQIGWSNAAGSSGTLRAVASILRANCWSDDVITLDHLRRIRKMLVASKRLSEVRIPGLDPDRVHVFPGGFSILHGVFKGLGVEKMIASTGAMREGVLYDLLGRISHEDVRVATIERVAQRYVVDRDHAHRVEKTALSYFDAVARDWELNSEEARQRLSWAAKLHEVGLLISHSGYHKHGAYILANSEMPGFSRDEQRYLAALIQAHRRKLKPPVITELLSVGGDEALRLAVILRLAVCFNRSRDPQLPPVFAMRAAKKQVSLTLSRSYLDENPLTEVDLSTEKQALSDAGIVLDLVIA